MPAHIIKPNMELLPGDSIIVNREPLAITAVSLLGGSKIEVRFEDGEELPLDIYGLSSVAV